MELKTPQTQLARYFSAWLNWWVNKNKYTQLQAAIRLNITPGFVNMLTNNKRAASIGQMEKIADTVNMELLDILLHGRDILLNANPMPSSVLALKTDFISAGLDQEQTMALMAYRALLIVGGEGVEMITEAILSLSRKKIPHL